MSRTQDEEFNLCQNNLLKLEETLNSIQSSLAASLTAWKSTFRSTLDLSSSLRSFFDRNDSAFTVTALRFESVHEAMNTSKLSLLEKLAADHITAPVTAYLSSLSDTKRRIKDRDASRQAFEHYHGKILKLRAEKDALTAKSKFGLKDHEKLQRNEAKYKEAALAYRTINRTVAQEMWDVYRRRFDVLEGVLFEAIKNEALFTRALANQLDPVLLDVKNAKSAAPPPSRSREPKEAPFFTAKPPVGLEDLEDDDSRAKAKLRRKGSARDVDDPDDNPGVDAEPDEDALFDDPADPVERKTRPPPRPRREEVKEVRAAPVVRRKPPPQAAAYEEEGEGEGEGYEEEHPLEEEEEVLSSQDFFAAAAASQPQRRAPPQRAASGPLTQPAPLPKKAPVRRAPAAPTAGDPFATLIGGAAIDPFFASAAAPAAAPAPKRKVAVNVAASHVDFFSNAMSVSSSSPVHSAFTPAAQVPFTDPVKPKVKKAAPAPSFASGLPPLPSPTAAADDPFAGLPFASSPTHAAPTSAADKPAVVDFFSSSAPAEPAPLPSPPRRPSLPPAGPPAATRSGSIDAPPPPVSHAQPPPPPPAAKARKRPSIPTPAEGEDWGEGAPAPLSPPAAAGPPPPPQPRQPKAAAPPPPPAGFAPPPPPAAKALPPAPPASRAAAPPPPPPPAYAAAAAPPPAPAPRVAAAVGPPPPLMSTRQPPAVGAGGGGGFQPPPPPPQVRKAPSRRRVEEDEEVEDRGPAFEIPEADSAGNDPFAAFN